MAVLAGLTGEGWLGAKSRLKLKLARTRYVVDYQLGYPTYRSWFAWEAAAEVADRVKADVVVLQSGYPVKIGLALARTNARVVVYLHNVELEDLGGSLAELRNITYIANSQFTARRFKDIYGIDAEVVYPLVERQKYQTISTRTNVTFINPHHLKGLETALAIAERCPEIPFSFIETWTLSDEESESLKRKVAALENVTLRPRTRSMKTVYGLTKIVLAPSRWEEAFGRVAAEAHLSGIPTVGTNIGGLPEAIGPGGILVDPDAAIEVWVSAVKNLWHDKEFYDEKSSAALSYSKRPEMDREYQISKLIDILGLKNSSTILTKTA